MSRERQLSALMSAVAALVTFAVAVIVVPEKLTRSVSLFGSTIRLQDGLLVLSGLFLALPVWVMIPKTVQKVLSGKTLADHQFDELYSRVVSERTVPDQEERTLPPRAKREKLFDWADEENGRLTLAPETEVYDERDLIFNLDKVDSLLNTVSIKREEVNRGKPIRIQLNDAIEAIKSDSFDAGDNDRRIDTADPRGDADEKDALLEELADTLDCPSTEGLVKQNVTDTVDDAAIIETVNRELDQLTSLTSEELIQPQKRTRGQRTVLQRVSDVRSSISEDEPSPTESQLVTRIKHILTLLEEVAERTAEERVAKEQAEQEAAKFESAFDDILSELDMSWVRTSMSASTVGDGGHRQGNHRDGPGRELAESPEKDHIQEEPELSVLRRAVDQDIVGERVAAVTAGEVLANKDLTPGNTEYDLLKTIENATPHNSPRESMEQAVEDIRRYVVLTDSLDTSVSAAGVHEVANRLESLLSEVNVGPLHNQLKEHAQRRAHAVENAQGNNLVTPYVTERHLSYLIDIVQPLRENTPDGTVDFSTIAEKRHEIERLSEQFDDITAGKRIPDHFLSLAEMLEQDAKEASRRDDDEHAQATIQATVQLLDAVIDLYKTRRLRKKLAKL